MKIFVEADSIAVDKMSGIGHATLELIRAIDKRIQGTDHSLTLIVPYGKKSFVSKYNFSNVRIRTLPPGYRYVNYLLVRTSIPLPVDIWYGKGLYIFPNYKNWYVPFSRSFTFVHDVVYKIFPETVQPSNLAYLRKNMVRWLTRTTKILTISHVSHQEIERFFPQFKDKIVTLYLGVDPAEYHSQSRDNIEAAKRKYDIHDNYFVYVGNVEPRKNIDRLLDAYKKYCDQVEKPVQLLLVGGGGWRNESIKKNIQQLQSDGYDINWPSVYVEDRDLPAIYSGATSLISIPIHEGYGLSLAQAQACGTHVMASNLPVFHETLDPKGVSYVDQNNSDDIASKMIEIANRQPRHEEVVNHTWDRTAFELLRLAGIIGDK